MRPTGSLPEARDEVRRFERFPLVIGRSSGCDLVLRDESRFISSNHAVITLVDGVPCIRDTSANGVFLNGADEALGRGNEAPLRDRDVVGVGDYALTVAFESGGEALPDDPFDALLDDGGALPGTPAPNGPPGGGVAAADVGHDPWFGNEPDWSTPPARAAEAPARSPANASDPFGGTPAGADDDWADWPPDPPVEAALSRSPPPSPDRPTAAPRAPSAAGRSAPVPGATAPARAAPAVGALGDALLLQCIEGLMALLRSRSELKQAMRTDVTALRGTGNNPLKFSRDGREALTRLLDPSPAGEYLAPEVALEQAIDDLTLHQVAMLEGMKGAVDALLARFDPDSLTERLTADHPIAANIPVTRDAKLWQLFREHYAAIEQAARGDFTAVFGREFRKAYEARIRELGREPELW